MYLYDSQRAPQVFCRFVVCQTESNDRTMSTTGAIITEYLDTNSMTQELLLTRARGGNLLIWYTVLNTLGGDL